MGDDLIFQESAHEPPLFHKRKSGQALVEAAIAIPILIMILVGMVDLGRMIYSKIVLTNAAREGAYYLSYHPNDIAGGEQAAISEAQHSGLPAVPSVQITSDPDCALDKCWLVTVTATLNGFYFKATTISSDYVIMMPVQ